MKNCLIAVLALALTGPALAGTPATSAEAAPPTTLEALDTNKNGLINRHEAKANPQLKRRFAVLDKNADHQIDKGEFAAFEARTPSR